jgi:putative copper resistance protein D
LATLFDIFGFVSVLLHGLDLVSQTLLLGSVSFVLFAAAPLAAAARPELEAIAASIRRLVLLAALATLITASASVALSGVILQETLAVSFREIAGARFVAAAAVKGMAAIGIVLAVGRNLPLAAWRRIAAALCALIVLIAAVATSHAVARISDSGLLEIATGAHELGAALWLGGLPCFWLVLRGVGSASIAGRIGASYSALSIAGVALITASAIVFAISYIGSLSAAYGTAYGAMVATKGVLFAVLLALGLANFRAVRRFASDPHATNRVRHFVEVEMGIGFAVLMAAASITSLPPGVDLVEDRLTGAEIAARMAPMIPRLESPDRAALALPALQARLDAEARSSQSASRLPAFVPGSGETPPRNAYDIAWSEYNHHWAGLLVAAIGLAAFARRSGRLTAARHWPLLFLLLAGFLFLRTDPEAWPIGEIGFIESWKEPDVAQHRLFVLLIVVFALFEWAVSTGRIVSRALARVFPLLVAIAGTLLLTHSHALGNAKEELLIEYSHLPIAVMGVTAGWARWLEVEAPLAEGRWAGWLWPACFVLIGLLLFGYREA